MILHKKQISQLSDQKIEPGQIQSDFVKFERLNFKN